MAVMDTIFGIIMTVGVFVMFIVTINAGEGINAITSKLHEIDPELIKPVGPPGWWPLLSLIVLTSIAPFAMPQLIIKFIAIRDRKAVNVGMIASTLFALLIGCIACIVSVAFAILGIRRGEQPRWPGVAGLGLSILPACGGVCILIAMLLDVLR